MKCSRYSRHNSLRWGNEIYGMPMRTHIQRWRYIGLKHKLQTTRKRRARETICWILARNSGVSLKDESLGTTIKLYSAQGDSNGLLSTVSVLGSIISSTLSLALSEDQWISSIIGVFELTAMFSIILAILEGTLTSSTTFESSTSSVGAVLTC